MKKLKNKINEAQIYIGEPDELPQVKPQLDKDDKLFITGDMNEDIDGEQVPMFAEYVSDIKGEEPFNIGETKWQFVKAKYPDGKKDIGVYRFDHDLVYGYEWFKNNIMQKTNSELDEGEYGIEGRDISDLKQDVEALFDRLDLAPIKNVLNKIDTPVEKFEVIAKFAEIIGIPRNKLGELTRNLKDYTQKENMGENINPRMSKGALLEHIKNINIYKK